MKRKVLVLVAMLALIFALVGCDGSTPGVSNYQPTDQESTRAVAAFLQVMSSGEQPEGATVTVTANVTRIDLENVITVYNSDTYAFDGFFITTMESDNSGSYDMELTISSDSLGGDIVIVFSFSFDSEFNLTVGTYTINGIDYSENEEFLDMMN